MPLPSLSAEPCVIKFLYLNDGAIDHERDYELMRAAVDARNPAREARHLGAMKVERCLLSGASLKEAWCGQPLKHRCGDDMVVISSHVGPRGLTMHASATENEPPRPPRR